MTDEHVESFKPVTYVSIKLGTRVKRIGGKRKYWEFNNGTLTLYNASDVEEMEKILEEFTGSSRALIKRVDPERAVQVAKKHQAAMLQLKNKVVQGVASASERASQIHEVTTHLTETEAKHRGLALQNPEVLGGQGQLGIVTSKDRQNPQPEVIAQKVEGTSNQASVQTVPVKLNPGKDTDKDRSVKFNLKPQ